jgi:hypothetical protein
MWQARCVRRSGSFASAAGTPKTKEFSVACHICGASDCHSEKLSRK